MKRMLNVLALVSVLFFVVSGLAVHDCFGADKWPYDSGNWPQGDYPGKWYGYHSPIQWVPPVAGFNPRFKDQKVIKSWGYKANPIEEIKDLIPGPFYDVIAHPEVWGDIRINETAPFKWGGPLYKRYQEATEKYKGTCFVAEDGSLCGGDPSGYKGGCPFPDPKTGDEIIWNYVKRFRGDDRSMPFDLAVVDRNGNTRYVAGENLMLYFNGRNVCGPKPLLEPNPRGFEFMQTFGYIEPYDLRGTTPLFYRYTDPKKMDDMWMYIPALRRVRRMSAAQRCDRIPGGANLTWDMFEGFAGKPAMYKFKLIGKKTFLASRNASYVPMIIKGKHLRGVDDYFQRVETYIVEAVPKDPNWVFSKLVLYIDPEMYFGTYLMSYDRKGRIWNVFQYTQAADAKWIPHPQNATHLDVQRIDSCSTCMFRNEFNQGIQPEFFKMAKLKKHFGAVR